jgi:hypothetical protein
MAATTGISQFPMSHHPAHPRHCTATFELWAVLKPAIDKIAAISPRLTICLHVDDLCIHAADPSIERCEDLLVAAAEVTTTEIRQLGMVFAPDKGFVLATTPSSAARLAQALSVPTTATDYTTRLGVDYSLRPDNQQIPARWHRFAVSLARAKRMPYLFKHGAPGLFSSGILPAALYGAEHQAVPMKQRQKLRRSAVRAWGSRPWGFPLTSPWSCTPLNKTHCSSLSRPLSPDGPGRFGYPRPHKGHLTMTS